MARRLRGSIYAVDPNKRSAVKLKRILEYDTHRGYKITVRKIKGGMGYGPNPEYAVIIGKRRHRDRRGHSRRSLGVGAFGLPNGKGIGIPRDLK